MREYLEIQKGRIVISNEDDGQFVPGRHGRRDRQTRRDKKSESNDTIKAKEESDSEGNLSRESAASVPIAEIYSG